MTQLTFSLLLLIPGVTGNVGCLLVPAIRERLSRAEKWAIWGPLVVYFILSVTHAHSVFPKSLGNVVEFLWIGAIGPGYLAARWAMKRARLGSGAQWLVVIASLALPCLVYFLGPTLPE